MSRHRKITDNNRDRVLKASLRIWKLWFEHYFQVALNISIYFLLVFSPNKNNRTSTDGKTRPWQPHYPTNPTIMKTKKKLKKCKYIVEINT